MKRERNEKEKKKLECRSAIVNIEDDLLLYSLYVYLSRMENKKRKKVLEFWKPRDFLNSIQTNFVCFFVCVCPQKIDLLDSKGHIYRHRGSCLDRILRANISFVYLLSLFYFILTIGRFFPCLYFLFLFFVLFSYASLYYFFLVSFSCCFSFIQTLVFFSFFGS